MLVLIKRKGKYYRFLSSEPLLRIPEAEIVSRARSVLRSNANPLQGSWSCYVENHTRFREGAEGREGEEEEEEGSNFSGYDQSSLGDFG